MHRIDFFITIRKNCCYIIVNLEKTNVIFGNEKIKAAITVHYYLSTT